VAGAIVVFDQPRQQLLQRQFLRAQVVLGEVELLQKRSGPAQFLVGLDPARHDHIHAIAAVSEHSAMRECLWMVRVSVQKLNWPQWPEFAPTWERIHNLCPGASFFLSRDWVDCWLSTFGVDLNLFRPRFLGQ
jgi:hypothetical protein